MLQRLSAYLVKYKSKLTGTIERLLSDKLSDIIDVADFGVNPSSNDNRQALQAAFNAVRLLGGGTVSVTKAGEYKLSGTVEIFANTHFKVAKGVTFVRDYETGDTLFRLSQGQASNVTVSGGVYEGNGHTKGDTPFVVFASTSNNDLKFEGITVNNVVDYHAIDLADWNNVVIRDCKFLGFKNTGSRNFSEAIQLYPGLITVGHYVQSSGMLVENCYAGPNPESGFGGYGALIGNHASAYGVQDNNIRILNCTTDGALFAGVHVFNWKNWTVRGCTFRNSNARGVHVTPVPSQTKPQGTRQGSVVDCTFDGVRTPVLIAAPSWPFTDISDIWHEHIEISNNTMILTEDVSYGVDARWCKNLIVKGNTGSGGLGLIGLRFGTKYHIEGNTWENGRGSGIWLGESDATTFIGTGLSGEGILSRNIFSKLGQYGIHVNCKASGIVIKANNMKEVSTAEAGRHFISIDTGANNILVEGNIGVDGESPNKPSLGIRVTSSCSNIKLIGNDCYGTQAPQNNQGVGSSTVIVYGLNGNPTTLGVGAPVGSLATDINGSGGSTLYIKESGTFAQGWVAK